MPAATGEEHWYVNVVIFDAAATMPTAMRAFALGPIASWSHAREIASEWERQHGPNTTEVASIPHYRVAREGVTATGMP